MGGELAVVSDRDHGSTFTVRLLLPNLGGEQHYIQEDDIIGYLGKYQKILIVDDQPEHRQLVMSILQPLGFGMTGCRLWRRMPGYGSKKTTGPHSSGFIHART